MSKDTGGPAFPGTQQAIVIPKELSGKAAAINIESNGMTLRDYFAAKAMQEVIADHHYSRLAMSMGYAEFAQEAAEDAYAIADAMLAERAK